MAARQNFYAETEAEASTTSGTYQDFAALTFTPDDNSSYLLLWSSSIKANNSLDDIHARLQNTTDTVTLAEFNARSNDTTDWMPVGGLAVVSFGASPGSKTYKVQYRRSDGTCFIRNARVVAVKLASADQHTASDTIVSTTSTSYQDAATLTFTPATSGEYLIIATAEESNSVEVRLLDPDGSTEYGRHITFSSNTSDKTRLTATIVKKTLPASSQSFKIQYRAPSGTAKIGRARIVALRLDQWEGIDYAEARSRTTTTSTSYQDKATDTETPAAVDHLMLFSGVIDTDSTSLSAFGQSDDGTTQVETIQEARAAGREAVGVWTVKRRTLSASSTTWKTRYHAESGVDTVGAYEHAIAVLQLDSAGTTFTITPAGTVTGAGVVAKQDQKRATGTTTGSGGVSKAPAKVTAGSSTGTGAIVRAITKALVGTSTPSGALALLRSRLLDLAGAITGHGAVASAVAKGLTGTSAAGGDVDRTITKSLAGSTTPEGALATARAVLLALAGSITPSGLLARLTAKGTAGSSTPAGDLTRQADKDLGGTATPDGTVTLPQLVSLGGAITVAGAMLRSTLKALTGASTGTGNLRRDTARAMAGQTSPAGNVSRSTAVGVAGTSTPAGSTTGTVGRPFAGSSTPGGAISRAVAKALTGSVEPGGAVGRASSKALVGAVSAVGEVLAQLVRARTLLRQRVTSRHPATTFDSAEPTSTVTTTEPPTAHTTTAPASARTSREPDHTQTTEFDAT